MTSHDDIVRRWVAREMGEHTGPNFSARRSNLWGTDGHLYSYGTHFELARPIRDRGRVVGWLANGDRVSVSTDRHQRITRNALARTGLPIIIVPRDALSSAGIMLDTIRPVEITDDRFETIPHRAYALPEGEIEKSVMTGTRITIETDDDGRAVYVWTTHRHWLGASLFRAAVRTGSSPRARRWAYFLSAFDDQETRPLYFLAELPRGARPETVADAFEALKPETVKAAEMMGRDITRQGDIFAVAMPGITTRGLRKDGAVIETGPRRKLVTRWRDLYTAEGDILTGDPVWHDEYAAGRIGETVEAFPDRGRGWRALLGQNHYATEVARMPDGTTYARGTMTHDPAGRDRDHAQRKMGDGKTWHLIVKNTVPLSK